MANEKIKSVTKKGTDNIDVRVEVRKIENGFIVRKTKDGYVGEGEKRTWINETKEWYSKEDPLEITDKSLVDIFSEQ